MYSNKECLKSGFHDSLLKSFEGHPNILNAEVTTTVWSLKETLDASYFE